MATEHKDKTVISKEESMWMMGTRKPVEGFPLLCWICEVDEQPTMQRLKNHIRGNHTEYVVSCQLCPAVFLNWNELGKHLINQHKLKPRAEFIRGTTEATEVAKEKYVLIKDRPCELLEYIPPKSGKRDEMIEIIGKDVFNGYSIKDTIPRFARLEIPEVIWKDYLLYDCTKGYVRLYVEGSGDIKDNVPLPADSDIRAVIEASSNAGYGLALPSDPDIRTRVEKIGHNVGFALVVRVISAMGREEVTEVFKVARESYLFIGVEDGNMLVVDEFFQPREGLKLPDDVHMLSEVEAAASSPSETRVEVVTVGDRDIVVGVRRGLTAL